MSIVGIGMLSACASTDRVNFVTTTNIAIDADATTQSLSIGYNRFEGYVGPAYASGAVPPIVAKIKSNLSVLTPEVHQFYATGNAAILATCEGGAARDEADTSPSAGGSETGVAIPCDLGERPELSGDKRLMLFGTGSVVGLKIGWAGNAPDSVTLGYKRKEFSSLPIGQRPKSDGRPNLSGQNGMPPAEQVDVYGSVLASIDMTTNVGTQTETGLMLGQFFATGIAAENLANTKVVRRAVEEEAAASVAASLRVVDASAAYDAEGNFTNAMLAKIDNAIYPEQQADPDNPIPDEVQFKKAQDCMLTSGAPTNRISALKNDPAYGKYIDLVADCMGLK